jgi:hypothetical protein
LGPTNQFVCTFLFLRRIFGAERQKVIGGRRKSHKAELDKLRDEMGSTCSMHAWGIWEIHKIELKNKVIPVTGCGVP